MLELDDEHVGPACILDPHFKDTVFASHNLRDKAKTQLLGMVRSTEHLDNQNGEEREIDNETTNVDPFDLDNLIKSTQPSNDAIESTDIPTQPQRIMTKAEVELDQYLSEPLLPLPRHKPKEGADPIEALKLNTKDHTIETLSWWRSNKTRFPLISHVAQQLLATPPSSADSERLFSEEGLIVTEKRNRLTAENAEKLLFISQNLTL